MTCGVRFTDCTLLRMTSVRRIDGSHELSIYPSLSCHAHSGNDDMVHEIHRMTFGFRGEVELARFCEMTSWTM